MNFLKYLPGRMIWRMPFRFSVANVLNPSYSLRCVLYHDISDSTSTFTNGLGVTVSTREFEEDLRFLAKHYTPVTLDEALCLSEHRDKKIRPVLLTFDDAYASVATQGAPLCQKYGIPAVLFVSGRFVDNQDMALDNLISHVANTRGFGAINKAACDALKSTVKLALSPRFARIFFRGFAANSGRYFGKVSRMPRDAPRKSWRGRRVFI